MRDKACLKIEIGDDGFDISFIVIVNIGRRPIKIQSVGLVTSSYPALYYFEFQPRMLNEGEDIQVQERFPPGSPEIFAGFAVDASGRKYFRGYTAGFAEIRQRFKVFCRTKN